MIIYTNKISIGNGIGIDEILSEIASWINHKTNKPNDTRHNPAYDITVDMLKENGDHDEVSHAKCRLSLLSGY